jgi:peptidoglycan/LPS O-acetylase OafA/YrhL
MSALSPAPESRPRVVNVAFWAWLVAALLLVAGGLLTATVNLPGLPPVFRGAGVLTAVVGIAVAFLAGRARSGDQPFRRAVLALSLTTVVLVALAAVLGVVHVLTLVALFPLIAGVVCITRPAAQEWFDAQDARK